MLDRQSMHDKFFLHVQKRYTQVPHNQFHTSIAIVRLLAHVIALARNRLPIDKTQP